MIFLDNDNFIDANRVRVFSSAFLPILCEQYADVSTRKGYFK